MLGQKLQYQCCSGTGQRCNKHGVTIIGARKLPGQCDIFYISCDHLDGRARKSQPVKYPLRPVVSYFKVHTRPFKYQSAIRETDRMMITSQRRSQAVTASVSASPRAFAVRIGAALMARIVRKRQSICPKQPNRRSDARCTAVSRASSFRLGSRIAATAAEAILIADIAVGMRRNATRASTNATTAVNPTATITYLISGRLRIPRPQVSAAASCV